MTFNSTIGIIGIVLAAIGIILTVLSFNKAVPFYTIAQTYVFNSGQEKIKEKKVQIFYDNNLVEHLMITQLCFWNGGNKLLSYENASSHVPLSICFDPNCKIFDFNIEYQSKEHNYTKVEFKREENCLLLTFDYLNSKEGFIIQIVHDYCKTNGLNIKGAFKGSADLKFSNEQPGTFDAIEVLTIIASYFVVSIWSSKTISHVAAIIITWTYIIILIIVFIRYFFYKKVKIVPKNLRIKL